MLAGAVTARRTGLAPPREVEDVRFVRRVCKLLVLVSGSPLLRRFSPVRLPLSMDVPATGEIALLRFGDTKLRSDLFESTEVYDYDYLEVNVDRSVKSVVEEPCLFR